ncbi:major facilitator superfamily transporter [Macrophomina phaseolina]|uniref:Major facilitator superfamily transporter n=1 Tax=Macrophomina phaseolina TaxID=35725 RepID=A0ABQ8FV98_9PEZI|nr:major facilitator superfamily transporter [Macrophomina phaseolina]
MAHHHARDFALAAPHLEDAKEPHVSGSSSPSAISLERLETGITANDRALLYKEGRIVLQPAPSSDPKDPLNMPLWRKTLAIGFLCFFGAMAAAAELILGAMLPVFVLEYAGMDPKILQVLSENGGLPKGSDPLQYLAQLPGAPPVWHVYLLGSLPVLMMGIANLFLVPLAISVGRRSVVLACGVLAIVGAVWAGFSQSLGSHLGARCLQALGAGTVESLLPFVVQDMVFIHQRNTAISGVFAAQGIIIMSLGIGTPYIIIDLNWRWVYYITAMAAGCFLMGVFFFVPETRWHRTQAQMSSAYSPTVSSPMLTSLLGGEIPAEIKEANPDILRVPLDHERFAPRTLRYDLALFHGDFEWQAGVTAFLDTLRTFFYPHIFFITMLNSAMIATAFAAGYTAAPALLTRPYSWPFKHLGFSLFAILIASVFVYALTGPLADRTANWAARRRGARVPENQVLNLILPTLLAIVGAVLFGLGGTHPDDYPWPVFVLGLGLMAFGFLGANTVGAVYVLESYPQLAGPALVNIASFRCLIAFALSFKISEWVAEMGYLESFGCVYAPIIGAFALFIPVVYVFGPAWRKKWPGPRRGGGGFF